MNKRKSKFDYLIKRVASAEGASEGEVRSQVSSLFPYQVKRGFLESVDNSLGKIAKREKVEHYDLATAFWLHATGQNSSWLMELRRKFGSSSRITLSHLVRKLNLPILNLKRGRIPAPKPRVVKKNSRLDLNSSNLPRLVLASYPQGKPLSALLPTSGVTRQRVYQIKDEVFEKPRGLLVAANILHGYNLALNSIAARSGLKDNALEAFRSKLGRTFWNYVVGSRLKNENLSASATSELLEIKGKLPRGGVAALTALLRRAYPDFSWIFGSKQPEVFAKIRSYLDAGHHPQAGYWQGTTDWQFRPVDTSVFPHAFGQPRVRTKDEKRLMHNLYSRAYFIMKKDEAGVERRFGGHGSWSKLLENEFGIVTLPLTRYRKTHQGLTGKAWITRQPRRSAS